MNPTTHIPLISSEITGIWNSYINDSMAICVLKHFINHVDDAETHGAIQYALELSNQHIETLKEIFNQENLPVPDGFSDKDVDIDAPRLFTDQYYLFYISYMSRIGLENYSLILNHSARSDIRDYFSRRVEECIDLYNRLADIRLAKGVFTRAPRVEVPRTVEYTRSSSFLTDLLGEKRPLLAMEVTAIYVDMLSVTLARALATGFGQVSKTEDVIHYMNRGKDILRKRTEIFAKLLTEEGIPIPSSSDSYVTDSSRPPFSDKLMLFHWLSISNTAISNYSESIKNSLRADLQTTFLRLLTETMNYCKDGMDILIAKGWMEQPPQSIKHENLSTV